MTKDRILKLKLDEPSLKLILLSLSHEEERAQRQVMLTFSLQMDKWEEQFRAKILHCKRVQKLIQRILGV